MLKDTLMNDLKIAMREKDVIRKNTVQMVRAAILQVEKDNKVELGDSEVLDIIAKELKKRRDVLPDYEKSGRQDLIQGINEEIEVLLGYLPTQLTDAEVMAIVKEAVLEVGATSMKDMGKLMSVILPRTSGKADGKVINKMIKEVLA